MTHVIRLRVVYDPDCSFKGFFFPTRSCAFYIDLWIDRLIDFRQTESHYVALTSPELCSPSLVGNLE